MRQHWMTFNCVTGPDQRFVLLNIFRRKPAIAYVTETSLFSWYCNLCHKMHACPYFSRIQNLYFKFPGQAESTFRPPQSSQVYLQAETRFRTYFWLKGCLQIWQTNFQWSRGVGLSFSNHTPSISWGSQRSSDCAIILNVAVMAAFHVKARWRTARMGKAQFFRTCSAHGTALVGRSSHEFLGSLFGSGYVSERRRIILKWKYGRSFACSETQGLNEVNFVLLSRWLLQFRFRPTKVICLLPHIMICQFQYGLLPWHYSRCACGMLGMNLELITGTVFCRSPAWLVSQSLAFWVWSPTDTRCDTSHFDLSQIFIFFIWVISCI